MLKPNQKYLIFLSFALLSSPLVARELTSSHIKLNPSPNSKPSAEIFSGASVIESAPEGDTYTIAPQVQDSEFTYLMSDVQTATSHKFDEDWKSGGQNLYGSPGGTIGIIEAVKDLGDGVIQISVQVTALDAQGAAEPWVDVQNASTGLSSWRLDVGSNLGGTNPIDPGSDYKVVESGISVFNSQGVRVSDVSLSEDTSDSSGLSGVGIIALTDGSDIAGYDMATMVMYWNIEIIPDNSGFNVTGGQSGAWYDPSHDGEGYVLQVISETQAVVYWFTYDKDGNQYWMIGVGEIQGSRIIFNDLQTTKGGKFGPEFDPADVERMSWGSLQFDFAGCDSAVVNYNGPSEFGSGTLNVQRLSKIWGVDCSGNNTATSGTGNGFLAPGFSGSWYDFNHDGEGFTLEILNETTALIYWFTYDTEGNQAWMMMIAEIQGASIFATDVYITSGGKFGPQFNPDDVVIEKWGAAVFSFGTCATSGHGGSMRYLPPPNFGIESTQLLSRLVFIESLDCMFLTDTHDVSGKMTVARNIFIDGDVNNPNVEEIPNDLDSESVQQLVPPAKVAGYATAVPTGVVGDRFESEIDEWDVYILALREGEGVSLMVSDWDSEDPESVDLDLYLVDVNDTEEPVDSSLTVDEMESVFAPSDGNYFVMVGAFAGSSNYLLESGQIGQFGNSMLSLSSEFVPNQVMASIKFNNSLQSVSDEVNYRIRIDSFETKHSIARLEESPDGDILYGLDNSQTYRLIPHPLTVAGLSKITPEEWRVIRVAKSLSANGDWRWAGPNYIYSTNTIPNDNYYSYQWHYSQIRLPEAWDNTRGSDDIVVAVVDSGVYDHPDLASNVNYGLGFDFVSNIFSSGDGDGIDSDARDPGDLYPSNRSYTSHGTHVAGTIGARTNNGAGVAGVNWNVTIMPLRVLGITGSGTCFDINESLRWAGRIANTSGRLPSVQADVINMSIGSTSSCPGQQDIINQLSNRDIIVVAAAGNEGNSIPNYPASFSNVVSVSATTIADELAYYSSYGSNIDIAGPGGDSSADLNNDSFPDGVLSNLMFVQEGSGEVETDYWFMQGTSMASPHIVGIAALMKSVYPDLGPSEFRTAISSGEITVDLAQNGGTVKDPHFGYGRVDALRAIQWAIKAEQGETSEAFMTSSSSALNFESEFQSMDLMIEKAGTGNLQLESFGTTENWISVAAVDVDQNNFGRYRVTVNRSGLVDGQYSGWAAFDASDGSRLWISVLMRVGINVSSDIGWAAALLLDQWTLGNVKTWLGNQSGAAFDIELYDSPPGTYYLMVGTDLDNDFIICDDGELCEIYPGGSQIKSIDVIDGDVDLGLFRMGFPTPISNSENSANQTMSATSRSNFLNEIEGNFGTNIVGKYEIDPLK